VIRLHVAYAVDETYAAHAAVSIASLLDTNRNHDVSILVVHDGLAEDTRTRLRRVVESRAATAIRFEDAAARVATLPTFARFPAAIYMRFLVPDLVGPGVERVLYLDADTIVRVDLADLWNVDLGRACVGAVTDFGAMAHQRERLDLGQGGAFFNNGVLLFDVPKWRLSNTTERLLAFLARRGPELLMPDQDAFNLVVAKEICRLPPKWNVQRPIFLDGHRELEMSPGEQKSLMRRPGILHFSHDPKPWQPTDRHPWGYLYRRIRARTPFHDPAIGRARLMHPMASLAALLKSLLLRSSPSAFIGLRDGWRRMRGGPTARQV
jgi:lipopolysaccharide biosynthesis glycosyltransferase